MIASNGDHFAPSLPKKLFSATFPFFWTFPVGAKVRLGPENENHATAADPHSSSADTRLPKMTFTINSRHLKKPFAGFLAGKFEWQAFSPPYLSHVSVCLTVTFLSSLSRPFPPLFSSSAAVAAEAAEIRPRDSPQSVSSRDATPSFFPPTSRGGGEGRWTCPS